MTTQDLTLRGTACSHHSDCTYHPLPCAATVPDIGVVLKSETRKCTSHRMELFGHTVVLSLCLPDAKAPSSACCFVKLSNSSSISVPIRYSLYIHAPGAYGDKTKELYSTLSHYGVVRPHKALRLTLKLKGSDVVAFAERHSNEIEVTWRVTLSSDAQDDSDTNGSDVVTETIGGDLKKLYAQGVLTDVSVCVGDQVFECHKALLAARSETFKAMFTSGMAESKESKITIKHVSSPRVFQAMLQFMYTDDCDDLIRDKTPRQHGKAEAVARVLDLLTLADQYMVSSLVARCTQFLIDSLHDETVGPTLLHADQHNNEILRSRCLMWLAEDGDRLSSMQLTHEWPKFRPTLVRDIVKSLAPLPDAHTLKRKAEDDAGLGEERPKKRARTDGGSDSDSS